MWTVVYADWPPCWGLWRAATDARLSPACLLQGPLPEYPVCLDLRSPVTGLSSPFTDWICESPYCHAVSLLWCYLMFRALWVYFWSCFCFPPADNMSFSAKEQINFECLITSSPEHLILCFSIFFLIWKADTETHKLLNSRDLLTFTLEKNHNEKLSRKINWILVQLYNFQSFNR